MGGLNFAEACLVYLSEMYKQTGTMENPVVLIGKDRIIFPYTLSVSQDEDAEDAAQRLHETVLGNIEGVIRTADPREIVVGYEAFQCCDDEKAVPVLVAIHYSDDKEVTWRSQIHEGVIGEWVELPEGYPLMGFEGLWSRAKAYLRN